MSSTVPSREYSGLDFAAEDADMSEKRVVGHETSCYDVHIWFDHCPDGELDCP